MTWSELRSNVRRSSLFLTLIFGQFFVGPDVLARQQRPHPANPVSAAAARREIRAAEQARAAGQAAQREAARRAEQAAATERRLAQDRSATIARLREAEEATSRVVLRLDQLGREQADAEARLRARAADLAPLLPLIQRLSLHPAETMLAVQRDQAAALRGALVLRSLASRLEEDAAGVRAEQANLATARRAVAAEQPRLVAARAAQAAQGAALDRQIEASQANRQAALEAGEQAARRSAEQAARAETLRAVIAEIETSRRTAEERARADVARAGRARLGTAVAEARRRQAAFASPTGTGTISKGAQPGGQLLVPVAGGVSRNWGDPTDVGPATGITWRPAPMARVLAPCSGKVMFAAPFRSFGLLLIMDCGGGYHAVLAGLDRIATPVGRLLSAGEPIGSMGNWDPGTSQGPRPSLYLELRKDGRPINPAPWLDGHG